MARFCSYTCKYPPKNYEPTVLTVKQITHNFGLRKMTLLEGPNMKIKILTLYF
jgi:hypothetical protein